MRVFFKKSSLEKVNDLVHVADIVTQTHRLQPCRIFLSPLAKLFVGAVSEMHPDAEFFPFDAIRLFLKCDVDFHLA